MGEALDILSKSSGAPGLILLFNKITKDSAQGTGAPANQTKCGSKKYIPLKKIVYDHVSGPKFTATIEFDDQGEKTGIRWHMLFETAEEFIQVVKTFKADEGLKQNIVKLNDYLATLKSV